MENNQKGAFSKRYLRDYPYNERKWRFEDGQPIMVLFSLIWGIFVLLIIVTIISGILAYVIGIAPTWLSSAWAGWGFLWVVVVILFIFSRRHFRPWLCMRGDLWSGKGHELENMAIRRAKLRLAEGEISLIEYKKIIKEIRREIK